MLCYPEKPKGFFFFPYLGKNSGGLPMKFCMKYRESLAYLWKTPKPRWKPESKRECRKHHDSNKARIPQPIVGIFAIFAIFLKVRK